MAKFARFPLQANAGHTRIAHIHTVLEGALRVEAAQVTEARTTARDVCFHFVIVVVCIDIYHVHVCSVEVLKSDQKTQVW